MTEDRAPSAGTPTIAVVGRPNVGKSTLFNRLVGRRQAIVHDQPGVTRDRISATAVLGGRSVQLLDTGGLMPGGDALGLHRQVLLAARECDLLLLVVDGKEGLTAADEAVWSELRRLGRPAVLAVNKSDTRAAADSFAEFHALGVAPQVAVSAEHGRGIGELVEALVEALPPESGAPPDDDVPRLALVGRPNVGKSSILNRLLGEERALVSPQPGTTRDPVDSRLRRDGEEYLLVDTAGIRRRSRMSGAPEELAVLFARRQVEAAAIALLVVEAPLGVTSGDLAIAGLIRELGRGAVVLVNKWDLLDEAGRRRLEESWPRLDEVLSSPRRINVSATTGRGMDKLFAPVAATLADYQLQLPTAEVNRLFREAVQRHGAPAERGRPWKLYYATQVATGPPTFVLFANRALPRSSPYRRYLDNFARQRLALRGVRVRLRIRRRD